MKPVLRYLIDITRHLDRRMIDRALVDALQPLADAGQVTIFEFLTSQGERWLRRRADCAVKPMPDEDAHSRQCRPVTDHPALARAILRHAAVVCEPGPDGSTIHWLPIWRGDQVGSCLRLIRRPALDAEELDQLDAILAIYKNFLALLDYSEEDSLTGLLNRKTFDQQFIELVGGLAVGAVPMPPTALSERRGDSGSIDNWLAVIDIDHFKQVNDRYGHLYGDEVLILLGNILKQAFREQDRVFRFGGEEFVVLLRSSTMANARSSFERLCECVRSHRFAQIDHVTISIGFVGISGQTPVTILGQADQALYFAKQNGRDRVCFYDELVASGELGNAAVNNDVDFF